MPTMKVRIFVDIRDVIVSDPGRRIRRDRVARDRITREAQWGPTMSNVVEDVAKAYFAALRRMDVEAWVALYADDATSYDPVGAASHVGKDAIRGFVRDFFALF